MRKPGPKKRKVRGRQPGVNVSPKQKERMLQLYGVEGNYTEVARMMGLSVGCVTKHIKTMIADPDPQITAARQRTARELAGLASRKAKQVFESITPQDLESGLIKNMDSNGELVSVRSYGPTLVAKATAGAILTDKIGVLADLEEALGSEREEGRLLMPGDIGSLMSGIKTKISKLTFLNVQFERDNPDLASRVQQIVEDAEIADAIVEDKALDFDGND